MALPLEAINLATLKRTLTAKHCPMGADETTLVEGFELDEDYIYVPRQFGLTYCASHGIDYEVRTSAGFEVTFPTTPTPRSYQVATVDRMIECFDSFYDYVFRAHTGWGKTVGTLLVAARLGTTTLIVVDQDNLKDQWIATLRDLFGMTVENGHVGIVQGKTHDYDGRSVVIAMVQTLSQKRFEPEFYEYFGLVAFDEVHTCGAPTFSTVLRQFSAMYRLGVSATPERKDGLQKLLEYSLGRIRVSADKEHNESAVYILEHHTVYSWYANISPKIGRIVNEVAEDGSRNLLIAERALSLYDTGRDVLVLSDRIEQLKHIQSIMYYLGAEPEILGMYAGYDPVQRYKKETKPQRRPNGWIANADSGVFEYTPVSLQSIAKRIPKKVLAATKASAGILLATYGMCAKGFDEPRLKAGIDAGPRSEVEQIHGRILREVPGLLMPIWTTIMDTQSYRLLFSFARRIAGYLKSNGVMYRWLDNGDLEQCQENELVAEAMESMAHLKSMRIETRSDGRNMLLTQASEKTRVRQRALDTVRKVREARR